MKIVFMGTPDLAAVVLQNLIDADGIDVAAVVTKPDMEKDRGKKLQMPPVKELALKYGIEVLQPEKVKVNEELHARLREIAPDAIVVAAYGKIIPKTILDIPKFGCINVHGSLLPRLRGASPINYAIVSGEKETGITIMRMDEGMDTGDMLISESIEIGKMNFEQLHDALAEIGGRLIVKALRMIENGEAVFIKQDDSKATYCGLIQKADGKIDFSKKPEEIERLIRGFDPWPGAFCDYGGETMKLWAADTTGEKTSAADGTIVAASKAGLDIACGGEILRVTMIQMPGKKRMDVASFLLGNKIEIGTVLK